MWDSRRVDGLGTSHVRIWTPVVLRHSQTKVFGIFPKGRRVDPIRLAALVGADVGPGPQRADANIELDDLIDRTRRELKLAQNARLRVALVGNHTTATEKTLATIPWGAGMGIRLPSYQGSQYPLKKGRTYIQELYEVLASRSARLEIAWLAEIGQQYRPQSECPAELWNIAEEVRAGIAASDGPVGLDTTTHSMRPSLPFLFTRQNAADPYQLWTATDGDGNFSKPFSTHDALLDAYADRPADASPSESAVLTMLLGADLSVQNPLDPPIVSGRTLDKCVEARVSCILLDQQVGLDFSTEEYRTDAVKVFRA